MSLTLYYHPFASFCQKVLIALYENDTAFEPRLIDLGDPDSRAELERAWPLVRFPVLLDEARDATVPESSIIIDYLQAHYPGPVRLVPDEADAATEARLLDRLFDNYIEVPLGTVVRDRLRPEEAKDPFGVDQAKALLADAYGAIEQRLGDRAWAAGESFTLADCAAAPALFYSNIVVPFADYPKLAAYYRRLLARPSFARVIEEARPYRALFPLGWPEDY